MSAAVGSGGEGLAPTAGAAAGARKQSIIETFIEVLADSGGLLRAEAALARAETGLNLRAAGLQSGKLLAGLVFLSLALVFLNIAVVVALAHFIGMLAALLIFAGLGTVAGGLLMRSGLRGLSSQQILPERTLGRISRDLGRLASRAALPEPLVASELEGSPRP
ncbi:MAG: phage holin family protein [Sandaracinobacteroides sp.]